VLYSTYECESTTADASASIFNLERFFGFFSSFRFTSPSASSQGLKRVRVNKDERDEKVETKNQRQKNSCLANNTWGRCYDHNLMRFSTIVGEKFAFFSTTNVMITILHNLAFL
jgi:hypothetical protein